MEGCIARLRNNDLGQLITRVVRDPRRHPVAELLSIVEQRRREHLDAVEWHVGAKNDARRWTVRDHDQQ